MLGFVVMCYACFCVLYLHHQQTEACLGSQWKLNFCLTRWGHCVERYFPLSCDPREVIYYICFFLKWMVSFWPNTPIVSHVHYSKRYIPIMYYVYLLHFSTQVGALFSLSCIITPVAQPAAGQLSSQRWRESIARRPQSLPGRTVRRPLVCFTFSSPR